MDAAATVLNLFQPATVAWFSAAFPDGPTPPQTEGWPAIARGESTLVFAPTGTGKTLAAFLWCIDRLMFREVSGKTARCRVLYVSPIKALAVDVERNLRSPLIGITTVASMRDAAIHVPTVAVRTGDTPAADRARFQREPADILITTPESLYLLLTSQAREALRSVETVIIDEIHALVPTKRGAHLALSLERLEVLTGRRLQRIGLSATQRPLDEVARFLGGAEPRDPTPHTVQTDVARYRPVTVIDAHARKLLDLRIEVPVEDMARLGEPIDIPSGPAAQGPVRASIWAAIHPRLLELIRAHTTTLLFVNSRRIAERLAAALNELAEETLVQAHHGSIARPQRLLIEDNLKLGRIRALVATSSLELGIDMGTVDLVIQIEAPPSVASGMQRIGRASHQVGARSRGVLFPKYRGDLVACAALTRAMHEGLVESTRYPRNPLDVLAQQIVAMVCIDPQPVDVLYRRLRQAAPFAELSRGIFENVLDMLSGRYESDAFAELRPRLTWDRVAGTLEPRVGAQRVAILNGGTIPDRGLYGVFLAGGKTGGARVGELDEEMVFESKVGETFLLGASTWRIEEITHDRVIVSPAPGQPGKMPFWHGDQASRPLELGQRIGALVRTLRALPATAALDMLVRDHDLDQQAAQNLLQYLADQTEATQVVPDDQNLLIERTRDELGDWRICVLCPLGGQVLAPWAMAVVARAKAMLGLDVETMWTNDGFVVRLPETEIPPDIAFLLPDADEVEALVVAHLSATALFAAKFRECSARALLLPRKRPGQRAPLWQQRKRASDLLAAASIHPGFPMLLEAYRECLRDVFDLPALVSVLREVQARTIRVTTVDSQVPSPFASAILFGFMANYLYDGDAPLAERRAQALAIDQSQLRELLGEAELRELLDLDAVHEIEATLQLRDPRFHAKNLDAVHDLLLRLGDLTAEELVERSASPEIARGVEQLVRTRRAVPIPLAGQVRYVAVEEAARYRDAFGVVLPPGLPEALLKSVADARLGLLHRYARTHGPFTTAEIAARFGLPRPVTDALLRTLHGAGRLLEGAFRPGGRELEWCDPEVLRSLRRRSLAKLRKEVEPVEPWVLTRFLQSWHGLVRRRTGPDALLDVVEKLQGLPLPASILERDVLPARLDGYHPGDLDALAAAGEIVWVGIEPMGEHDGRIALYLTDHLRALRRPDDTVPELTTREAAVIGQLRKAGASFFQPLHDGLGGGFPDETVDALWSLVWKGLVTNDTFGVLRAYLRPTSARTGGRERRMASSGRAFRSRRTVPPAAEGRWALLESPAETRPTPTQWSHALASQLLARYGVVTRDVAQAEGVPGGFSAVYAVFQRLEETGRARRGYFVSDVAALQFALPPVLDLLRALRTPAEQPERLTLSAVDPANPYGALLKWPTLDAPVARGPSRTAGAHVVFVDGHLGAWIGRGGKQVFVWLPEDEPDRSQRGRHVAEHLAQEALRSPEGMLLAEINGTPATQHALGRFLEDAGFLRSVQGFHLSRRGVTGARR
jgi:ATP-dependent Lhr-like helicase